jgi:hypothetical protein
MTNPLALHDVDNEMLKDADDYLRKHKILELFEVSAKSFDTIGPDNPASLQTTRKR